MTLTGDDIAYSLLHDDELRMTDNARPIWSLSRVTSAWTPKLAMIRVSAADARHGFDDESVNEFNLVLRASDPNVATLNEDLNIQINIIDTNVASLSSTKPSRLLTHATVSEGAALWARWSTPTRATDEDGDPIEYRLRDQDDAPFFTVEETTNAAGEAIGILRTNAGLDYETQTQHTVEIQAADTDDDTDEIVITIDVTNANDNSPVFGADSFRPH